MNVLLLGMGWFPDQAGGSNRYFRQLLERLRTNGHGARGVVIGPAEGAGAAVAVAAAADDRIGLRLLRFKRAAEALGRPADLVDVHFALYAFLPVVLGRLRGKPLAIHFHGPWADESAAAGAGSRASVAARRMLERAVYRRAGAAITLSGAFKRILVERYGVPPWRITVVPPGVDLEQFSPGDRQAARSELNVDVDTWIACSVRRLTPRTGVDVLLRAWAQLDGKRLLLIAGHGPERHRLERLADELGIAELVRFVGSVSEDQLVAIYRAADVSIVPSTALEGFGLVVLESLACGTPVVASDIEGLPSALAGLEPRTVVPVGDEVALAERLREPMPERGACRVAAKRFSWEQSVQRHRELYRRLMRPDAERAMRVVCLAHTARLSGAELALLRTLPALKGVDVHVILGEDGPLAGRLLDAGISVEVMPLARRAAMLPRYQVGRRILGSRESVQAAVYALRMAMRLRRLRPDLVQTNSLKAAFYGGFAARLAGIPVVSHIHDRVADDYLPPEAARLTRSALARLPNAVIVPSRTVAETVGRAAVVIPCPADAPVTRSVLNPGQPLSVGMVGRIAPWKGQHIFIDAFARAFPDGDANAVIIGAPLFGSDEEQYLEELRALARERGLNGRLSFTGFVKDVPAELAVLDVLVHASVLPEPFGQVVVEGMAAGLAVVAADDGGPAEMITHGIDGLLYRSGDAAALASALTRLGGDRELRRRLGAAAQKQAAAYAPGPIAARIREVYADVLAANSAKKTAAREYRQDP